MNNSFKTISPINNSVYLERNYHNNIDETLIEKYITKNTKAIMPVHLYGLSCNMDEIVNIAEKYNLIIIAFIK